MENATKALLIAGGILIAIVILTVAVYLYTSFSEQTKQYSEIISATELQKFNSKFEVHIGRTDITAQEVVSMANLAKEYDYQVKIFLDNKQMDFKSITAETRPEQFLMNNVENDEEKLFSCTLSTSDSNPNPEYDENGKIIKVKFTTNS